MGRARSLRAYRAPLLLALLGAAACSTTSPDKPRLAYPPEEFAAEVDRRVPGLPKRLAGAPYEVDDAVIERSREMLRQLPRGPQRIQALVAFLGEPQPDGLGIVYDFAATGSAEATIERRRGNCVSLAMLLVGIARGLGWPAYFVEVRSRRPETKDFVGIRTVSDHMAVLIPVESYTRIVDFTGRVDDELLEVNVIDDVTAYAHVLNNLSAQRVMLADGEPDAAAWDAAIQGFELATQLQPKLGRAWNNLGIALTRRGRFDEARVMYERAVELDTAFGAAEHNLTLMETRAEGVARVRAAPLPGASPSGRDD